MRGAHASLWFMAKPVHGEWLMINGPILVND